MQRIKQLSKQLNRTPQCIALWCKANDVSKFRGAYYLNPIQIEMYKAQMTDRNNNKKIETREQVLKPIVSNDEILKIRIKKLKLLVEVAELDLLKSAVMEQINEIDNV